MKLRFAFALAVLLVSCNSPLAATDIRSAATEFRMCDGFRVTIEGTSGDDVIMGTHNSDIIAAGAGDDIVRGGDLDDRICGEDGDDLIFAGTGADRGFGGAGDDRLRASWGLDYLSGGPGNDWLRDSAMAGSATGDYPLDGGSGDDTFVGYGPVSFRSSPGPITIDLQAGIATGDGFDTLVRVRDVLGSRYSDSIRGSRGDDSISGAGGHDLIVGGRGSDWLIGGWGNDMLLGGAGRDELTGLDGTTGPPPFLVDDDVISGGPGRDRACFRGQPHFLSGGLLSGIVNDEGFDWISSVEERGT